MIVAATLALGYFGAQVAMRVTVSDALELDEAEQSLWTQAFEFGYGPQPPLYTWLQMAVFQLLGPSVLGLAMLKNTLLAITYGSLWMAARRLMPAPLAVTAALSPLLLLQIGWESQRDLTHSVLATTLASLTFLLVLRLLERPRELARWSMLGLVLGLGSLSKYSFAGFAVILMAAVLALPETRALLRSRRTWLGAALLGSVALAVFLPHGLWLPDHAAAASEHALQKLSASPMARGTQVARGLGSFAFAVLAFLSPLWLLLLGLFGAAWWKRPWAGADAQAPSSTARADSDDHDADDPDTRRSALARRLARNYALALLVFFAMLVIVGGASHFRNRWLQPFLIVAPVLAFAMAPWLARHPRRRVLHACCAVAAVCWLAWAGGRVVANGLRATPDELNEPVAALAQALRASGAVPQGAFTLVSSDMALAGSLRLAFPQAQTLVARDAAALDAVLRGRSGTSSKPGSASLQAPVVAIQRGEEGSCAAPWSRRLGDDRPAPARTGPLSTDRSGPDGKSGQPLEACVGSWRFPVRYAQPNGPTVLYRVWSLP
ncbi:MAG TPA: glycosyltransferase family 39 protein [Rubrivivax sp.]|nr:glycosyltransferase family 39 protein [Rubrivivax sp.]